MVSIMKLYYTCSLEHFTLVHNTADRRQAAQGIHGFPDIFTMQVTRGDTEPRCLAPISSIQRFGMGNIPASEAGAHALPQSDNAAEPQQPQARLHSFRTDATQMAWLLHNWLSCLTGGLFGRQMTLMHFKPKMGCI